MIIPYEGKGIIIIIIIIIIVSHLDRKSTVVFVRTIYIFFYQSNYLSMKDNVLMNKRYPYPIYKSQQRPYNMKPNET